MKLNHPFMGGKNSTEQRRKLCLFPYTNKIMGMTTVLLKRNGHNKPVHSHSLGYKPFKCLFLTRNIRSSHPEHFNMHPSKCHKRSKIIHQRVLETLCHKSWKLPPSKAVLGEGQRILLNASSVFYFLENREKSPLQYLFTNTWSCIRMPVFSPKILSKTTIRGQSTLKFFWGLEIPTKEVNYVKRFSCISISQT